MAEFTIIFEGLICHVGSEDKKKHAVMVHDNAGMHTPKVFANKTINQGDNFEHDLEDHDTIEFESGDFKSGMATTTAEFKQLIPGLKDLLEDNDGTKKKLKDKVDSGDHDNQDSVVAFIKYPKDGILTAHDVLDDQIKFTHGDGRDPKQQCVARLVILTIPVNSIVTMTIKHTQKRQDLIVNMEPNSIVAFTNSAGQGNHFHLYHGLTEAGNMATASSGDPCQSQRPAIRFFVSTNPECTNSGWP